MSARVWLTWAPAGRREPVDGSGAELLLLTSDHGDAAGWGRTADIGSDMRAAEAALRRPFLELMADLAHRHASAEWWASRVSERNPMVSGLFARCCHLRVAVGRLAGDRPLVVASDSAGLLHAMEAAARDAGRPVVWLHRPPVMRLWAGNVLRAARSAVSWLRRWAGVRHAAPAPGSPPSGRVALIRTWIDDASLGDDGRLHDRYFPGLAEHLRGRGWTVVTAPVLFNLARSARDAWRFLERAPGRHLSIERCLRGADLPKVVAAAARSARLPRGPQRLAGHDITALVAEERRRFAFDLGTLEALAVERALRRLAATGWRLDVVFDPYEGMAIEKLLALGVRASMPGARIVGYQHSAVPPMLLCNFVTGSEAGVAPLPDRVICSGEAFRELLVAEGLPPERALPGPSLRYRHLFEDRDDHAGRRDGVLVPLPLVPDARDELLARVLAALAGEVDAPLWIKPHPMTSSGDVDALGRSLPAGAELVAGPMDGWLARSRLAVTAGSATVIECLAAGVPIVVVGRGRAIDLNPLAWEPELGEALVESDAIRERARLLLTLAPDELAGYRRRAEEILHRCFAPVTPEALDAFVRAAEGG